MVDEGRMRSGREMLRRETVVAALLVVQDLGAGYKRSSTRCDGRGLTMPACVLLEGKQTRQDKQTGGQHDQD